MPSTEPGEPSLRRAVGDTGEAQDVIRTVPRRDFRFVADLDPGPAGPAPDGGNGINGEGANLHTPAVPATPPETHLATVMPILAVLPFKIASEGLDRYFCDGSSDSSRTR